MTVEQNPRRSLSPLEPLTGKLESASFLDAPGAAIGDAVRNVLSPGAVKDALSGTWLGHAVHPVLTDVVIGSLLGSTMLDLVGGDRSAPASERLIAIGLAAFGPTAVTGVNDWADSELADDRVRRVGLVHAASNTVALSLYAGSLAVRRRGARRRGALLGAAGAAALSVAGHLGGHLSFTRGVGPDQTAFDPGPTDWAPVDDETRVSDDRPARVIVEDTPILLSRIGDRLFAIHDRCSHRGCSLSDGEVDGDSIVCACHGSRFDRRDGSLRHGPATAPQPAFDVREREGRIEVRRREG